MFGVSFDIGTTTCVCTLVDLRNGATAAVASTINRQASYGADVIARMAKAMHGQENIDQLKAAALDTVNELLARVQEEAERQARGDLRGGRGRQRDDDVACCWA